MDSKHSLKPIPSSSSRFLHDPSNNHHNPLEPDNGSSSSSDYWKTQCRKEALVAHIERIRENNLKRREGIYTKAWQELHETQNALMSNPPTEINYLVRLHRESLKREQELVAVRVYHDHLISAARAAFEAEVKSIEEEFTNARTQAKEKLLESLEERRKKLKDEKELVDFNEEAVGHSHRTHATRGLRNRSSNRSGFPRGSPYHINNNLETGFNNHQDQLSGEQDVPPSNATGLLPSGSFITADDPFSMATLNVDPHLRQSPIFQQLLQLGANHHSRRGGGGRRAPTGLPTSISLTSITPGTWNNFHKSQLGICSARNDDADADVEEIRNLAGLFSPKKRRSNNASNNPNPNPSHQNSSTLHHYREKSKKWSDFKSIVDLSCICGNELSIQVIYMLYLCTSYFAALLLIVFFFFFWKVERESPRTRKLNRPARLIVLFLFLNLSFTIRWDQIMYELRLVGSWYDLADFFFIKPWLISSSIEMVLIIVIHCF